MRDLSEILLGVCLYCWRAKYTRAISFRDRICESCDERAVPRNSPDSIWEPWSDQLKREAKERFASKSFGSGTRKAA